ncbi:MAG: PfkB family carbohydrate kinase [Planctomycetota bacterium]
MHSTPSKPCIVGIGEALFDVFEAGPRLGGAPLNVAVHAHRLLQNAGGEGRVVSRIADDELGNRLLDAVTGFGLSTSTIQLGADAPTGRVEVEQHDGGDHTFHIAASSAWDEIEFDAKAAALAARCAAVAFGTLAQRRDPARQSIRAFLAAAPQALKLFDVNFRSSDGRDFFDRDTLVAGCEDADLVKINDEEVQQTCELAEVENEQELLLRYSLDAVILTRGKRGTAALTAGGWAEGASASYERAEDADSVGAGDACTAGLLASLVLGRSIPQALDLANHMGALVANQSGATPELPTRLADWLD